MFTVFLLVVLATTVVSFTSDRASDDRNTNDKASRLLSHVVRGCCGSYPNAACHPCSCKDRPSYCGQGR
uniref:Alpha-conotoxin PIVA n=1 Tax=Conus purpurascens TaxID=41690 RepID=CA4A_CONPU